MSQNPSPVNHAAAAPSPPSPQQLPNEMLPLDGSIVDNSSVEVVDAEEVQASSVAEQQPPLDGADIEEGGDGDNDDEFLPLLVAITLRFQIYELDMPASYKRIEKYISVDLQELRSNLECPICLGIIKKCRTIAECLHRFCKDCIEKAMRKGRNECPTCRIHCPSRRSLKDDPRFDTLISALIPDIEKFEEEEMLFLDEERVRNEQIMAAIAEIARRQSEVMPKRCRHT